ncbi:MAG: 4Fe-4S cluster-binding domain-containing protein [Elusimicrobiota bacterium]|nr:4Fe-4S cluster-binding domain-containing protein [Elusimicrobiota bacterium]
MEKQAEQYKKFIDVVSINQSFQDFPHPNKIALVIYVSGCEKECIGCHNPDLQQFGFGNNVLDMESFEKLIEEENLKYKTCNNIVFSGGDPLCGTNIDFIKEFLERNPRYNVCIYTGDRTFQVKDKLKDWKVRPKFIKYGAFDFKTQRSSGKTDEGFVLASTNQGFMRGSDFKILSKDGVLVFRRKKECLLKKILNKITKQKMFMSLLAVEKVA